MINVLYSFERGSELEYNIRYNLTWNTHKEEIVKKANKRMYSLVLLCKVGVPLLDIVIFYCTCVRPLLEYCALVFHHALPSYLSEDLEKIQKQGTVIAIILPALASKPYRVDVNQYVLTLSINFK